MCVCRGGGEVGQAVWGGGVGVAVHDLGLHLGGRAGCPEGSASL